MVLEATDEELASLELELTVTLELLLDAFALAPRGVVGRVKRRVKLMAIMEVLNFIRLSVFILKIIICS